MTANPPTVLCIDDDASFAYAVERHFQANGYRVVTANSAMAALEQWEKNIIDIVITDIRLSSDGPDGVLLAKMIKDESATVPIIFMTAYPDYIAHRKDLPGRVVYKPVELSVLRQVVENSLAA